MKMMEVSKLEPIVMVAMADVNKEEAMGGTWVSNHLTMSAWDANNAGVVACSFIVRGRRSCTLYVHYVDDVVWRRCVDVLTRMLMTTTVMQTLALMFR
jgi:hypothetical protein